MSGGVLKPWVEDGPNKCILTFVPVACTSFETFGFLIWFTRLYKTCM